MIIWYAVEVPISMNPVSSRCQEHRIASELWMHCVYTDLIYLNFTTIYLYIPSFLCRQRFWTADTIILVPFFYVVCSFDPINMPPTHLSVYVVVDLTVSLFIHPFIHLSIHFVLSIQPSTPESIHRFIMDPVLASTISEFHFFLPKFACLSFYVGVASICFLLRVPSMFGPWRTVRATLNSIADVLANVWYVYPGSHCKNRYAYVAARSSLDCSEEEIQRFGSSCATFKGKYVCETQAPESCERNLKGERNTDDEWSGIFHGHCWAQDLLVQGVFWDSAWTDSSVDAWSFAPSNCCVSALADVRVDPCESLMLQCFSSRHTPMTCVLKNRSPLMGKIVIRWAQKQAVFMAVFG